MTAQHSLGWVTARDADDLAADGARAGGYEWLHADFDERLRPFCLDVCGFTPTSAGLLRLQP